MLGDQQALLTAEVDLLLAAAELHEDRVARLVGSVTSRLVGVLILISAAVWSYDLGVAAQWIRPLVR